MPGESQGQRSLAGCGPWGHRESDTTEATAQHTRFLTPAPPCDARQLEHESTGDKCSYVADREGGTVYRQNMGAIASLECVLMRILYFELFNSGLTVFFFQDVQNVALLPSGLCGDKKSTGKFHPQALFQGRDEACYCREGWVTGLGHVQDVVPSGDSRAWLFSSLTWRQN